MCIHTIQGKGRSPFLIPDPVNQYKAEDRTTVGDGIRDSLAAPALAIVAWQTIYII